MQRRAVKDLRDEEWVAGLRRRDEAAVGELLDRYWERAYRVALRLQGDPGSAEDVAQETFLQVLESIDRFDPARAFRPWFFTILRRVASNHRRASKRRSTREAVAAVPERVLPALSDAAEAVQHYLEGLEPNLREALSLHYLGGLTHKEVGEVLGCPAGTASYWIGRGIEKLRSSVRPAHGVALGVGEVLALLRVEDLPAAPAAVELAAELSRAPAPIPMAPSASALVGSAGRGSMRFSGVLAILLVLAFAGSVVWILGSDLESTSNEPAATEVAASSTPPEANVLEEPESRDLEPPAQDRESVVEEVPPTDPPSLESSEDQAEPLRGRVLFRGQPLAGVKVALAEEACTGPDGLFRIQSETGTGTVELSIGLRPLLEWCDPLESSVYFVAGDSEGSDWSLRQSVDVESWRGSCTYRSRLPRGGSSTTPAESRS